MKILSVLFLFLHALAFLIYICGCAYISHTKATVKAKGAKAALYGKIDNGEVLMERRMCVGFLVNDCKKNNK